MFASEVLTMLSSRSKMDGFFLVVELTLEGSVTNEANPFSLHTVHQFIDNLHFLRCYGDQILQFPLRGPRHLHASHCSPVEFEKATEFLKCHQMPKSQKGEMFFAAEILVGRAHQKCGREAAVVVVEI